MTPIDLTPQSKILSESREPQNQNDNQQGVASEIEQVGAAELQLSQVKYEQMIIDMKQQLHDIVANMNKCLVCLQDWL